MQKDSLQRFIFKDRAVRGAWVYLDESYQTITGQHHYPPLLSTLLGETLLGVILIASHFKQQGQTTLQFQGSGTLKLVSARMTQDHEIRGLVRADPDLISIKNLQDALHSGQLTLSYEGQHVGQNYQSVIDVAEPSIATALEQYFLRSEQLPTRFFLARTDQVAAGLLLQMMPAADPDIAREDFQHATIMAQTLKDAELLTLSLEEILKRLYPEDDLEAFASVPISFGCNCTQAKMEQVVRSLGLSEAESILEQHAFIEVICEFCNQSHRFGPERVVEIFKK